MNTAFSFDPRYGRLFGIPKELRDLPQWCVADMREGPGHKSPLNPYTGERAKVNDPATWGTFADAMAAAQSCGWPVGIVFSAHDPYCVIDLDNKPANPASERDLAIHRALLEQFNTYTERSVSGSGAHIIAKGAVPKGANFGHVEMYSEARFAICTGDVINEAPIADCSPDVSRWYGLLAGARESVDGHVHVSAPETHSDAELFQRMTTGARAARNYALLTMPHHALVSEGFITGYDTSPSVSVGKLIMELCFLTQNDVQVRRMLAESVIGNAWHAEDVRDQQRRIGLSIGTARGKLEAQRRAELADKPLEQLTPEERAPYEAAAYSIGALAATGGRAPLTPAQAHERFHIMPRAELLAQPPLEWLVHNVLPAHGVASMYGHSGSGKTFLAIDLAIHLSMRTPTAWFGYPIDNGAPVTYMALEGSRGLAKRLQAWEKEQGEIADDLLGFVDADFSLVDNGADVEALARVLLDKDRRNGLIIIDTLSRAAHGADENSSQDMGKLIKHAGMLQRAVGGLVLLVHHTRKDGEGRDGMRGHSSLFAALDAAIEVIKTQDGEETQHQWKLTKSKDGEDSKLHGFKLAVVPLGLDDKRRPLTSCAVLPLLNGTVVRASGRAQKKSRTVADGPTHSAQRMAWAEIVTETKTNPVHNLPQLPDGQAALHWTATELAIRRALRHRKDVKGRDIEKLFESLHAGGFVQQFDVDGERYVTVHGLNGINSSHQTALTG